MTELTKKVLEFLEPDTSKWEYWTTSQPLNSISESACMERFKKRIAQAVSNCESLPVTMIVTVSAQQPLWFQD